MIHFIRKLRQEIPRKIDLQYIKHKTLVYNSRKKEVADYLPSYAILAIIFKTISITVIYSFNRFQKEFLFSFLEYN
jgi:hypothetical protein